MLNPDLLQAKHDLAQFPFCDQADAKSVFAQIRNFLAGRALGATRDLALLEEVMKCLLVRKVMLLNGGTREGLNEHELAVAYQTHFRKVAGLFPDSSKISLSLSALKFVHDALRRIDLLDSSGDPVGDLYQTFIGAGVRGQEGQFFTPANAGRWLVNAVAPSVGDRVIDPACGAGGFLLWAAQYLPLGLKLVGIEKDDFLARLALCRAVILGQDVSVFCANSLSFESDDPHFPGAELVEAFDVVLTNPPFGKNIVSVSVEIQRSFDLGHRWRRNGSGELIKTASLASKIPPQVLFLERIISLLKKGGRAGVVVPESMLSSSSYAHVIHYLRSHAAVRSVVGMPESLFKTSGKTGTHTKTALIVFEKGQPQRHVFMAEAKWCGNDSRGRVIDRDDLPLIADELASNKKSELKISYRVAPEELRAGVLAPRYYEPLARSAIAHLRKSHELATIDELIDDGILAVATGDEVGKLSYGTGEIPFVRTSDISGWEIKIDPKHLVSREIYLRFRDKQDVREGDVLMVRDGTYLIGNCAFITQYDREITYQSHILKFRCRQPHIINPYLLIAVLSSDPVQKQIKAKTFTQDIIDSLGSRHAELSLPIPRDRVLRRKIERLVQKVISDRVEARELARKAKMLVAALN